MAGSVNHRPRPARQRKGDAEGGSGAGEHTKLLNEVSEFPVTNAQERSFQAEEEAQVYYAVSNVDERHRIGTPCLPTRKVESSRSQPENPAVAGERVSVISTARNVSLGDNAEPDALPTKV